MLIHREQYVQCPYCTDHVGGHKVRVPRSVGKYRVKIIHNNVLIFKCAKCSGVFKMLTDGIIYKWKFMNNKEKAIFTKTRYKGGMK